MRCLPCVVMMCVFKAVSVDQCQITEYREKAGNLWPERLIASVASTVAVHSDENSDSLSSGEVGSRRTSDRC